MKKYSISIIALIMCVNISYAGSQIGGMQVAKAAVGLLGLALAAGITDSFKESPIAIHVAESTNLDIEDVASATAIPLMAMGIRSAVKDDMGIYMDHVASRAIPAALVTYLLQTKCVRKVFSHIPIFGKYLTCENKHCSGACHKCKLRTGIVMIGSYNILNIMLNQAGKRCNTRGYTGIGYYLSDMDAKAHIASKNYNA